MKRATSWLRGLLLAPGFNQALRLACAPVPRGWLPLALRKRMPVVGEFTVHLASGESFSFRSRGEYLGRVLYWHGLAAFEPGSPEIVAQLARRCGCLWDIGAYGGLYTLIGCVASGLLECPLTRGKDWPEEKTALLEELGVLVRGVEA